MNIGVIFCFNISKFVHPGKNKQFVFGDMQNFGAGSSRQKLPFFIEQFQCIPLFGIMAGGKNNSAIGIFPDDGNFGGWRGCQADVNHIAAHAG